MSLEDTWLGFPLWLWAAGGFLLVAGIIWWARYHSPEFRNLTDRIYDIATMILVIATVLLCLFFISNWLMTEAGRRLPSIP